ncbi:MAG TPA: helix-turn-helix domain-containing protein [Terriglobia bacterium]|jgi:excisionase family DNA binding protein|nr:helix-turn-helix domain-containing protein [Terriglobia bacterium]
MPTSFMTENSLASDKRLGEFRTEPERLLTVREVAELLSVPRTWVYERTRQRGVNRLPHLKMGKYVRFRLSDVQAYLETLRHG